MPDTDLVVHSGSLPGPLRDHDLDAAARAFAASSKSAATRRAYNSDWRHFSGWCVGQGASLLPVDDQTLIRYFSHLAQTGLAVSTIDRRAAAISFAHRRADCDAPIGHEAVRAVLTGIRNSLGRRPEKKKALTVDLVARVVRRIDADLAGLRDRAMILLCFGAALRRSELVALDVANVEQHRKGLLIRLLRSKTDQAGQGRTVAVPDGKLKIPQAVLAWVDAAGIMDGPLFRGADRNKLSANRLTAGQFARMLKMRCAAVGLDPKQIGGHSARRGFASSAGDAGADVRHIAKHLRHAKTRNDPGLHRGCRPVPRESRQEVPVMLTATVGRFEVLRSTGQDLVGPSSGPSQLREQQTPDW